MHSFWYRLNAVITYTVTVLAVVISICAVTTLIIPSNPQIQLRLNSIQLRRSLHLGQHAGGNDQAMLRFDILADLRSVFSWNVKQLFVYLTAEYKTEGNIVNEIVVWDKIIQRGDISNLVLSNIQSKYSLIDQGSGLRSNNVSLSLHWNIMPYAGVLFYDRSKPLYTVFPSDYT
mmetsp:Transcript_41377/g.67127  ORF Transcript_41377/g.67127 Transcript_41377/m.67127 type:complete len:174 (-) Transcript_41377:77-598(-)